MWTVLYTALITLLILLSVHHLYNYLKSNLTTPITNDVVSFRDKKMEEIKKEPQELTSLLEHFKKST
jgi:predicted RecB family endonuclease